ncbi:MAG: S8 family serine peptidase [Flavobacteriales bacterium]|nr:S8 family serine peptidase [Flavobacteriales bacterium]
MLFIRFTFILCLFFNIQALKAQDLFAIYLKDKKGSTYNPYVFLHPKSVERRINEGLDLYDPEDFPVSRNYEKKIRALSDTFIGSSRWFNAVFIQTDQKRLQQIRQFDFVDRIETFVQDHMNHATSMKTKVTGQKFDSTLSASRTALIKAQTGRMGSQALADSGLDGSGVIICIIDVGFKSCKENEMYLKLNKRNAILKTYDFVKKRENVNIGLAHGTSVLSCIGGQTDDYKTGLATGARFLLARTENFTEFLKEEVNWLLAAEWADQNGADIINSSLGYTISRYLPEQMDGKTAFVSKAAQKATEKGILVISSAGNEGSGKWKRIAAPGDAKDVLTVGGVDPSTGIHIYFSSFGPTWDKRLKPEISSFGKVVSVGNCGYTFSQGTSFSAPLVTGFAACLKQKYPTIKQKELKELICRSGDLWPYYDYAHGYGVPQPYFLFKDTIVNVATFNVFDEKNSITILPIRNAPKNNTFNPSNTKDSLNYGKLMKDSALWVDTANNILNGELLIYDQNKVSEYSTQTPTYLYYHIKNKKGYLDKYYVMDMEEKENQRLTISKTISEPPFEIEIYYKGFYKSISIKQ